MEHTCDPAHGANLKENEEGGGEEMPAVDEHGTGNLCQRGPKPQGDAKVGRSRACGRAQPGTIGRRAPPHMTPCVCHCAACRAAGCGTGPCVKLRAGLLDLFDGKADVAHLILRHYAALRGDRCSAPFDEPIFCVRFGPGGDVIAAAGGRDGPHSAAPGRRIHLLCANTGQNILSTVTGHSDLIYDLDFDPTGSIFEDLILASCGKDKTVRLHDVSAGQELSTWDSRGHCKDNPECTCAHGRSSSDYTANPDCSASGHTKRVFGVAFHPTRGNVLASCSADKSIRVWNTHTGAVLSTLHVDAGTWGVNCVSYSPSGDTIAAACSNGTIHLLDASTGGAKQSLSDPLGALGGGSQLLCLSFSPSGDILAAGNEDGDVRLYDPATGQAKSALGVGRPISCIEFLPCGTKIAAAFNVGLGWTFKEGRVKILSSKTGAVLCTLNVAGEVRSMAISPDGSKIAAAFNVFDGDYDFQNSGVQIFSTAGGHADVLRR